MLEPQNANAGFYRATKSRDGRATTVIYSTLDKLHLGQGYAGSDYFVRVDNSNDLEIHATDLELIGDIKLPGGRIKIVCRRLTIPEPRDGQEFAITLDVSGPVSLDSPYDRPLATAGASGRDGDDVASAVNADGASPFVPASVSLPAKPSFAAKGANGGSILILADEVRFNGRLRLVANGGVGYPGCNGENASGRNGAPGRAGRGGPGGDGGKIEIGFGKTAGMSLGAGVNAELQPGKPGCDGAPGYNQDTKASGKRALPVEDGKGGELVEANARDIRTRIGRNADNAFFYRLHQKARRDYLFADADSWAELGESLRFIADVTEQYGNKQADHPVAYRVYRKTNGLYNSWTNNRNIYGWSQQWVPSTPWETMRKGFDDGQKFWQLLFDRVQAAVKEDAKREEAQKALNDARKHAYDQVRIHEAKRDLYAGELGKLARRLSEGHSNFDRTKTALTAALGDLTQVVKDHFECPSMENILSAAETVVFTLSNPGEAAAMAGVQIAKFINDGTTKIGSIDKSELVDEIVDLRSRTAGFADSVKEIGYDVGRDGELTPKPGQRLMLAKMEDLETEISGLKKKLGDDATKPVLDAIDALRSAILELGESRYLYNTYALRAFEEGEAAVEARHGLDKLDKAPDPQSED